jgi:hypothetical protein
VSLSAQSGNGAIITPMRRFPPPWTIEEHNNACFIVKDATRQALGYFYFEEEPGRRSAAKPLTRDLNASRWVVPQFEILSNLPADYCSFPSARPRSHSRQWVGSISTERLARTSRQPKQSR